MSLDGLDNKIVSKFEDLASQLSPENISCDGMSTSCEINEKRKAILSEWVKLERKICRRVSLDDIETRYIDKFKS